MDHLLEILFTEPADSYIHRGLTLFGVESSHIWGQMGEEKDNQIWRASFAHFFTSVFGGKPKIQEKMAATTQKDELITAV